MITREYLETAIRTEIEALFNTAIFDLSGNPQATADRVLRLVERFVDSTDPTGDET